jgi:hypothetical protein
MDDKQFVSPKFLIPPMWVPQSEYDQGLDPILFTEVKKWLDAAWPFTKVVYPDRVNNE